VRAPRARGLAAGRVWLASAVLELIVAEAESRAPLETGGVLLGWAAEDGPDLVVSRMLGPGPRAVNKRTRFSPDSRWQRKGIARVYRESARVLAYLGDWHSHPGGSSSPSGRDLRTARRIARHRSARVRAPLMLILAGSGGDWRPVPYRLLDSELVRLECVPAEGVPHEQGREPGSEDEVLA
jgi:integrative and conjugative element protein (TIGR02256 family)